MLTICKSCHDSLRKHSKDRNPPKFAIANGFQIGELPDNLKDSTFLEIWLTSLAAVTSPVFTLHGGKDKYLPCHGVAYNSNPYEIFDLPQGIPFSQMKL